MSLLLLEGFDAGSVEWIARATSNVGTVQRSGRTGPTSFEPSNTDFVRYTFPTADRHATFVVGMAVKGGGGGSFGLLKLYGDDFVTEHIAVDTTSTGRFRVFRGGVMLGQTDSNVMQGNVWHYLELFVTLSDTVGVVKLRIDGKIPPGWADLTNADTKNGGTATVFDSVQIGYSGTWNVDDIYICNGAGTKNNDLLGDTQVFTLLPNGNGNYSQLTGSDGNSIDNYLLVDETGNPSMADYVESATDGQKDTYTFEDLVPTTGTIIGVQVGMYALKSDAAAKSIRAVHRRGVTDSTGSDKTLQTVADVHDQIWEDDPAAAAAWSITNVNLSEFGAEVRP